MKLINSDNDQLLFLLAPREKDLLLQVLHLYPRIPQGYQPLSRAAAAREEPSQHLLDEALTETRLENKKLLDSILSNPQKLSEREGAWRLALSPGDLEWILQVLNDIRVGSWIELGSPESPLKALNAKTAPQFWAMEMAGTFQMRFLELLDG